MKIRNKPHLFIQEKIFLDRAEISAVTESKKVGLVILKRDSLSGDWRVNKFYSDRTYDKSGEFTRKFYESIKQRENIELMEDEILNNLINHMERD